MDGAVIAEGAAVAALKADTLYKSAGKPDLGPTEAKIANETKGNVDRASAAHDRFAASWLRLKTKYYTVTPADARSINSYYVLTDLYNIVKP